MSTELNPALAALRSESVTALVAPGAGSLPVGIMCHAGRSFECLFDGCSHPEHPCSINPGSEHSAAYYDGESCYWCGRVMALADLAELNEQANP